MSVLSKRTSKAMLDGQSFHSCKSCNQSLPPSAFGSDKSRPDGRQFYCRGCVSARVKNYRNKNHNLVTQKRREYAERTKDIRAAYQKAYKTRNPHVYLRNSLKRFSMSELDYETMFESQNGACAICSTTQSDLRRRLDIDHHHKTGQIRGLLCSACNTGIGTFRDSPGRLRAAAAYLERKEETGGWSEFS